MMDRIDIHVDVPRIAFEKLTAQHRGESSADVRARVEAARGRQTERFKEINLFANADMGTSEIRAFCELDETGRQLMKSAMSQMGLSARAFHRVLKVARTIADLTGAEAIQSAHLAEALQYRPRSL
jgi:magnesium chelatase family protein